MALRLELRNLWTCTGGPRSWSYDGDGEQDLRSLLSNLDEFKADPVNQSAVLLATDDDAAIIGAWNRDGAAQLISSIDSTGRLPEWLDLRNALYDGVTGP